MERPASVEKCGGELPLHEGYTATRYMRFFGPVTIYRYEQPVA